MTVARGRSFQVPPIQKGYDSTVSLVYSQGFAAAFGLAGASLAAQFRARAMDAAALFAASTADGSMIISDLGTGGVQIDIHVPGTVTGAFPLAGVTFDIAAVQGGTRRLVPGQWTWPVRLPVTRLP